MYTTEKKEDLAIQKLQEQLETQYGPAVAQDIIDRLVRGTVKGRAPGYMDVKALSELQERLRGQAVMAVWRLRQWRKTAKPAFENTTLVPLEGAFLHRQCAEALSLYRLVTKSYFAAYRDAMAAFATLSPAVHIQEGARA